MKCTKCGKNEVSYHFRSDINGKKTEAHLCSECAAEMGLENEFFSQESEIFSDIFEDMFSGSFFGRSAMSPMRGFDPFGMTALKTMFMPRIYVISENGEKTGGQDTLSQEETKVDPELSKRRELNVLREKMQAAAQEENYEEAARLRDEIKNLESQEK